MHFLERFGKLATRDPECVQFSNCFVHPTRVYARLHTTISFAVHRHHQIAVHPAVEYEKSRFSLSTTNRKMCGEHQLLKKQ